MNLMCMFFKHANLQTIQNNPNSFFANYKKMNLFNCDDEKPCDDDGVVLFHSRIFFFI